MNDVLSMGVISGPYLHGKGSVGGGHGWRDIVGFVW